MAYQALYRKYRPDTFCDVVGQEHITATLLNELKSGKISHAYLFTGTRGTGKTSCAKILAKAVNCLSLCDGEPCKECSCCISFENGTNTDIIEIDAASNNGVDDIRELRDQINFAPAYSRYRVYIIDEVHMLSSGAFNALLKTLEEPPEHVIFILATTEVHKLPATILSRCQRFDFHRIEAKSIISRLKEIAEKECLKVTDSALDLVASAADGSMRDALSIFDLCASNNTEIDESTVEKICGIASKEYLLQMTENIKSRNIEAALLLLNKLYSNSVDMVRLIDELTKHYRNLMIVKTVKGENLPIVCTKDHLLKLKEQAKNYPLSEILSVLSLLQASYQNMQSGNKKLEAEMTLIRLCNPSSKADIISLKDRIEKIERNLTFSDIKTASSVNASPDITPFETIPKPENDFDNGIEVETAALVEKSAKESGDVSDIEAKTLDGKLPDSQWYDIIKTVNKSCPAIGALLGGSCAYIDGNILRINSDNPMFISMMRQNLYNDYIREAAKSVLGIKLRIGPYKKPGELQDEDDPLRSIAEKLKNLS